jgi:hypothetical protein
MNERQTDALSRVRRSKSRLHRGRQPAEKTPRQARVIDENDATKPPRSAINLHRGPM